MADDLNDLGGAQLWRPTIEWREAPENSFDVSFIVLEAPGSSHEVIAISKEKPHKHNFSITLQTKAYEYDLVQKFYELKGRLTRFWFMNPLNLFTLLGWHGMGASALTVFFNEFDYRGYERIYIEMKNGDILTHKITGLVEDEENGKATLQLNGITDRDINPMDIKIFSLLHLARLDIDGLDIQHRNTRFSETRLRLLELVKEYSEI